MRAMPLIQQPTTQKHPCHQFTHGPVTNRPGDASNRWHRVCNSDTEPECRPNGEAKELNMDNSMEQRFVDRLLHALAAMGQYESVPKSTVPVPVPLPTQQSAPIQSPFPH